ncbi:hypothetical protein Scep_019850 [Stephania cephalantha]|uniref:Uncharacterized protein n=1 Tax=Stephania cephalantha TaxID=152367 RepID=A0AAP0NQ84_9MAGN
MNMANALVYCYVLISTHEKDLVIINNLNIFSKNFKFANDFKKEMNSKCLSKRSKESMN